MNRRRFLQLFSTAIVGLGLQPLTGLVNSSQDQMRCAYLGENCLHDLESLSVEYSLGGEIELPETFIITRSGYDVIGVYSEERWQQILLNFSKSNLHQELRYAILRNRIAPAIQVFTDNKRMIIPDYMRQFAKFQKHDLLLVFNGDKGLLTAFC